MKTIKDGCRCLSGGLWIWALCGLALFGADKFPRALPKLRMEQVLPQWQLERPVWMEELRGRFYVAEQRGRILSVSRHGDGKDSKEFFNIVDRKPYVENEEGLLGFAFHPGYATNQQFYVYYSQQNPRRSVISEFKAVANLDQIELKSERVLMAVPQPYSNHNGGQISFGPDGYLYISLGDGGSGNDPHNHGQNTASLLGKMLRIDVNTRFAAEKKTLEYGIPSDNPFAKPSYDIRPEIWAYGLRNVWRFSWDRETAELWAGDVGQNLWEEIHIIVKGGNYGWCVREGFHPFKPGPDGAKYAEPIAEYPHTAATADQSPFAHEGFGLSITGGYVYRGQKQPSLRGVYIYGDYVLGTVFGLRWQGGRVLDQAIMLQQPLNIMSFAQDAAGELYVLTQDGGIHALIAEAKK